MRTSAPASACRRRNRWRCRPGPARSWSRRAARSATTSSASPRRSARSASGRAWWPTCSSGPACRRPTRRARSRHTSPRSTDSRVGKAKRGHRRVGTLRFAHPTPISLTTALPRRDARRNRQNAARLRRREEAMCHVLARLVGAALLPALAFGAPALADPPKLPVPAVDQSAVALRGYFYVGGKYVGDPGKEIMQGQTYVEVLAPKDVRRPYPLVLIHGAAQTATNWMGTPDGRKGWA